MRTMSAIVENEPAPVWQPPVLCRRRKHIWRVVDRIEQPSATEAMRAAGTPITGSGLWPDQLRQLTRKPVVVTRECSVCGLEEVHRV